MRAPGANGAPSRRLGRGAHLALDSNEEPIMKNDHDLKTDVESQLEWDLGSNEAHIGVCAEDGVVILSGHVPTVAEKDAAERAVTHVRGVQAIANELVVSRLQDEHPSDAELAVRCLDALRESRFDECVQVIVRRQWVTLEGVLDFSYQERAAELAVKHLRGVVGVTNNIHVHAPSDPF
jgi:osmotically-inducible protein OsmY